MGELYLFSTSIFATSFSGGKKYLWLNVAVFMRETQLFWIGDRHKFIPPRHFCLKRKCQKSYYFL